jgi:hypothetical protein
VYVSFGSDHFSYGSVCLTIASHKSIDHSVTLVSPTIMRISAFTAVLFSSFLLVDSARSVMLRALQTDDSKKCPANQLHLPDVQYGCPASCDQPVPLCKAAIGPGCGCPDGTVLAGTSLPRRFRCIPKEKCASDHVDLPPPPQKCIVSGCSGEVCAAEEVNMICIVPTCAVSCLTKFGTCQSNPDYPTVKFQCDWNTSATEKEYQACLVACGTDGDY